MKKPIVVNYFPSVLAGFAVAVLAFGMDFQTRSVDQKDLRADVAAETEVLRARLSSQIETGEIITRGVASLLSREGDPTQTAFSALVNDVTEGRPDVINIAWAPDLVITLVHPIEPNQAAIGLDYRQTPAQLNDVLKARDTGQIAFVGPINLVQGGKGFIMRVPVYSTSTGDFEFRGILSSVFDLEPFLIRTGIIDPSLDIEVALSNGHSPESVFYGDAGLLADTPVQAEVTLPGGTWHLHARPKAGWASAHSSLFVQRLLLSFLAAVILVPLIVANRLAIARQNTIRDMEIADARLKAFVRNSPGVFFTYLQTKGEKDRIEFITDACKDIWNADPVDIYHHPGIIWRAFDDAQVADFNAEIDRSRSTHTPWNFTWKSTTRDGQVKWLEGWGHPHAAVDGVTRWDCFVVDITQQRQREEEFEQQAEIARQAQKQESIGQLTGGMAHDFNNMLAVVRGNMEMLQDDLTAEGIADDERLEFVAGAIKAAERGNDLTKKMLSFARRASLNPEVLNINEIIRELEDWSGRTLPATMTLQNALSRDLPQIRVDRSSAASAILNLMVNARDAMPEGGELRIMTRKRQLSTKDLATLGLDLAAGAYVELSVLDTGEGIPADKLQTVFEPFYTTKGPGAGSGLGLSMVQGFVVQSGGSIRITSDLGKGTCVSLYFPAIETSDQKPALGQVSTGQRASQGMLRILLAEDEPEVRKVLERTLERLGHTVVAAKDGDSALRVFEGDQDFDLLMTDIVMPGRLQGTALARAVRSLRPGFPVIVMTGYTDVPLDEATGLNPEDIRLSKPVARADLIRAIEATFQQARNPVGQV